MLETLFIVVATALLTCLILSLYVRRALPNLLEDVAVGAGESISMKLNETLANPNVKKAFTILGKQSGEARADTALQNKAATAIVGQSPVISFALDKIGITPLEGVKLMNDPLFGPLIKDMISSFTGPSKGGGSSSSSSQGQAVGRM